MISESLVSCVEPGIVGLALGDILSERVMVKALDHEFESHRNQEDILVTKGHRERDGETANGSTVTPWNLTGCPIFEVWETRHSFDLSDGA